MIARIIKKFRLLCGLFVFFSSITASAVDVTLKGGSEIKEGAEILKQATEIVLMLITIDSIKLLMLILLGFAIALQGIWMLTKGIIEFIEGKYVFKKGGLLCLIGLFFISVGISIIFKDDLLNCFQKQTPCIIHTTKSQPQAMPNQEPLEK